MLFRQHYFDCTDGVLDIYSTFWYNSSFGKPDEIIDVKSN